MNILVTGAKGFIGRNLVASLNNIHGDNDRLSSVSPNLTVYEYDAETDFALLEEFCAKADFVFNLVGVNRTKNPTEFMTGNYDFASALLNTMKKHNNTCPVMMASSIQVAMETPYGKSKKAGEDLLFRYAFETGAKVLVYRFPNVFGKWCRPDYNSAVATFCSNIARDLPITVSDRSAVMHLAYIDDVVAELTHALTNEENRVGNYCEVPTVYTITLGRIADLLYSFKASRNIRAIPDMGDAFTKKLYATYLSYLPENQFAYDLKMNCDLRGSFTEIIRTRDRGQFSVSIIKPGITRGNHWHNTKNEKFAVVSGRGVIRLRKIGENKVCDYYVSGDKMQLVDIPTGYTHNITNLGDTDMVTFIWASEPYDPDKPDTFSLDV